jgi:hypothetical protein
MVNRRGEMASLPPSWLPKIFSIDGSWEQVLKRLYAVFRTDFIHHKCKFIDMPVWWDRRKTEDSDYEEGFWHLITKIDRKGERLWDPRRAERLPWCKPTLTHSAESEIKSWDFYESNGKIRTYVWLEQWDYLVIVEKRRQDIGMVAFLITAYHIDYESKRRSLNAKYGKRVA